MAAPDEGGGDLQLIGEIDRIIHEPARLLILSFLYVVEAADFIFLMRETGLTKGNLSSHLNKLEGAGYIDVVKEFLTLDPEKLKLKATAVAVVGDRILAVGSVEEVKGVVVEQPYTVDSTFADKV